MSISPEEAPVEDYESEDINPPDRFRKSQSGSTQAFPEKFAVGADFEVPFRSGVEERPQWGLQRRECRSEKDIAIQSASLKISSNEIRIGTVCQLLKVEYS